MKRRIDICQKCQWFEHLDSIDSNLCCIVPDVIAPSSIGKKYESKEVPKHCIMLAEYSILEWNEESE